MFKLSSRRLRPTTKAGKWRRYGDLQRRVTAARLKIVFVGTEVAPWSKVGGLADVMHALPVALARHGHQVMTVTPLYECYRQIKDSGCIVPIRGRVLKEEESEEVRYARLHRCRRKGVDRVFVEHPTFERSHQTQSINRCPSSVIYPYYDPGSNGNAFEIGCSVLCQSAIYAPSLIWEKPLEGISVGSMLTKRWDSTMEKFVKDDCHLDGRNETELIFICNDWPCGLLPIWLKHIIASAKHSSSEPIKEKRFEDKGNLLNTLLNDSGMKPTGMTDDDVTANAASYSKRMHTRHSFEDIIDSRSSLEGHLLWNEDHYTSQVMEETQNSALHHSKVVLLIHNAEYTGPEFLSSMERLKLIDPPINTIQDIGTATWLETGMLESDAVVTVSPGYATEMHTKLKSHSISSLQSLNIQGITNGIDTSIWNPSEDEFLSRSIKYTSDTVTRGKARAKRSLQRSLGLRGDVECPLFGFIGRLDWQKGVDILCEAMLQRLTSHIAPVAQFVLLGCGNPILEHHLSAIQYWCPGMAVGLPIFRERWAHAILAASDFLIFPSRFEPCGLVALSALRYGTVPICPAVGGLNALVQDDRYGQPLALELKRDPNGSLHDNGRHLVDAIEKAIGLYGDANFEVLRRRCMKADVSWDQPAKEWNALLESLVQDRETHRTH